MSIQTKRVYDEPSKRDGYRLLVMRVWPRGVKKDAVDRWEKELGPSRELLRDFRARRIEWPEFRRRYRQEQRRQRELIDELRKFSRRRRVTLLCGCEDASRCHRTLLKELVEKS